MLQCIVNVPTFGENIVQIYFKNTVRRAVAKLFWERFPFGGYRSLGRAKLLVYAFEKQTSGGASPGILAR